MKKQKPILPPLPPEGVKPEECVVGESLAVQSAKHWWESKVIRFNMLVMVVTVITTATPALEQYMSAESYGVLTSIIALVNALLRFSTNQPIVAPANMSDGGTDD